MLKVQKALELHSFLRSDDNITGAAVFLTGW